jgi:hypothetical protein
MLILIKMITITKNSLLFSEFGTKNTNPDYIIKVSDNEFFHYLNDTVELSNDVRFERIFDLLITNQELVNKIFYTSLNGYKIQNWLYDFNKKSTIRSKDYLRVKWHTDIFTDELSIRANIYLDNKSKVETDRYSTITFCSLSDIKKQFVKLDKSLVLNDIKHRKEFTLYDIINGILKEIAFNGIPAERDKRKYELDELLKRIDSGEEKMYTSEEVKEHLKEFIKTLEDKKATK